MNLSGLQTFLAIDETGSLVKASKQLHVSQSTITARLQSLESDLGQTLFRRHKSGVFLTASGTKFKRYAETMLDLWRQARQETSLPEGINVVCNLGCHLDLWPDMGRQMITKIRTDYPDTAISAWHGKADELDQWLSTGLIDAALSYHPGSQENQNSHLLRNEQLQLYSTEPDSPICFGIEYIYVDAGRDFGRRHTAAYADAGIAPVSVGSAAWAIDYMIDRAGAAYLPENMAAPYLKSKQLYPVADAPVFSRNTYLVVNEMTIESWPWFNIMLKWLKSAFRKP